MKVNNPNKCIEKRETKMEVIEWNNLNNSGHHASVQS